MAEPNLQEIHDLFIKIARQAGVMIMSAHPNAVGSGTKKNSADLVTETDKAVEVMVSTELMGKYPSYEFIGEETYKPGMQLTDAPTFIVDPIDGTTNFVHSFPSVCISLGFAVNKIPAVGVIYNPFLDQLYTAIKGHGAFVSRNGGDKMRLPLRDPEPLKDLSTALVGVEWGSDRNGVNFNLKARVFTKLAAAKEDGGSMVHSLRSLGSAALHMCALSAGQQDIYWEGGCWAWDVCAGLAVLKESGGLMVGGNPGDWEGAIDGRTYLAVRGAPSGQREIIEELWKVIGDGRLEYST